MITFEEFSYYYTVVEGTDPAHPDYYVYKVYNKDDEDNMFVKLVGWFSTDGNAPGVYSYKVSENTKYPDLDPAVLSVVDGVETLMPDDKYCNIIFAEDTLSDLTKKVPDIIPAMAERNKLRKL